MAAQDLTNLQALRSNLIQTLATEATAQAAGTGKPSYSIDGQSVSWNEWRAAMWAQINELTHAIQLEQTPFQIVSRVTG